MAGSIVVILVAWALLSAIGFVVLGRLPAHPRRLLLPAAPVVGAAALIVVLHYVNLVMGVRSGLWLVLLALVVMLVLNFRADRRWWALPRRGVALFLLAGVLGVVPASVALRPSALVGDSRVVQISNNNDAYYYVSVIDWVTGHRMRQGITFTHDPALGGSPMSVKPVEQHAAAHMRIGQELVQAFLNVVMHQPATSTWYPLTALWILILPAAALGFAVCLKMRPLSGLALGLAMSSSGLVLFQLVQQNSDSLLGIAMMTLAVGAFLSAIGRNPVVGRVFAALMVVALIGSYVEYAPVLAPGLLLGVVVRPRGEIGAALRRALQILGLTVLLSPFAWWNAGHSLLYLGGISRDSSKSPLLGVGMVRVLNRLTGATGISGGRHVSLLTVVLALLLGVGVAAVLLSRRRPAMLAFALVGGMFAYYLGVMKHRPYSQFRAVEIWLPLLLMVVAFGFDRLYERLRLTPWAASVGIRPALLVVTMLIPTLAWTGANLHSSTNLMSNKRAILARHVDSSFAQAAGWLEQVGGPQGADTTVFTPNFFDQLWIGEALKSRPRTAYPFLYISYEKYPSYWSGTLTRWVLIDNSVLTDIDPAMVVHRNKRFTLLDTSRGQGILACNSTESRVAGLFVLATPGAARHLTVSGYVVTPDGPAVLPSAPGPRPAADGPMLAEGLLRPTVTSLKLELPAGASTNFRMTDGTNAFVVRRISRAQ